MAYKYNPLTGQGADEEDSSSGNILSGIASAVGSFSPVAGVALQAAPAVLNTVFGEEETPSPPATTTSTSVGSPEGPSDFAPVATSQAPASPPAAGTAVPAPSKTPRGIPEELVPLQTTFNSGTTTGTIVSPQMRQSDKEVLDAEAQGRQANDLEAKNRVAKAEIENAQLDIDATQKKADAQRAKLQFEEGQRRYKELEADAKAKVAAKQKYAAENSSFWKVPGVDPKDKDNIHNRQNWSLSLMFGNIAEALGDSSDNVGRNLLEKTMSDWVTERDKSLLRLEKEADKAGGLQQTFWRNYGEEAKVQNDIAIQAGYLDIADRVDALNVKKKGLTSGDALAANARAAADYRQKAADRQQKMLNERASKFTSGNTSTTYANPALRGKGAAAADKARSETLLDLDGNVVGQAFRPDEGEKIRAGHAATNSLHDTITRLQGFTDKNGPRLLPAVEASERKVRDGLIATATGHLTSMFATGVLNENEYKRYKEMLEPGIFDSKASARKTLEELRTTTGENYNRRLGSQGIDTKSLPSTAKFRTTGAPTGAADGGADGEIVQVRNRKTGQMMQARRGADGQLHPVQ